MPDNGQITIKGFQIQDEPKMYLATIPGDWLIEHADPRWRVNDPIAGFQRIINQERAKCIAVAVLDLHRTFPNAIVLATDKLSFNKTDLQLEIPSDTRFFVVDGQHRLWAQKYSDYIGHYPCVIHMGLTEVDMAKLFLEINDNQKRVPSSLRWDLIRLVRPEDDPNALATTEIVYQLAMEKDSPLYQRIDLTGENSGITLKQGSIAPEIKSLLSSHFKLSKFGYDPFDYILGQYLLAMKELDKDNWMQGKSVFYQARILRALLRLLPDIFRIITREYGDTYEISVVDFIKYLEKIDKDSLSPENIRSMQAGGGIKAICDIIRKQIIGDMTE
ncbi:DGQHR domain-containing protein [Dehalococcoides mccartyi]|uniref:DGQHR domain-containing protein n=1 Tax=Dehalococcoides mccartyi TaxID=61435 RepID=UPI00107EE8D7|nr:DGQHR domain-containing protein [Dehalococcoides mccartyi]QBX64046.1 DGQHR domain-containing protein [Dehalococcoides mccartyi]